MNQMTNFGQLADPKGPMTTPITNLDTLIADSGLGAKRRIGCLVGFNLGYNSLAISIPMNDFFDISDVASEVNIGDKPAYEGEGIAQRPLDRKHAEKLAVYILRGLMNATIEWYHRRGEQPPKSLLRIRDKLGTQPYFSLQPIVANIRNIGFGGTSGLEFEKGEDGLVFVMLSLKDVLWIIDGQHRRFGMAMVFDFLRQLLTTMKYPRRPGLFPNPEKIEKIDSDEMQAWAKVYEIGRTQSSVNVEVHLGLDVRQERQLFHDLNNLGKKVEGGLAFNFDEANPVNKWIKQVLMDQQVLSAKVVDRDVTDWQQDDGRIARKDLIAINAILLLNKTNVSSALPGDVQAKEGVAEKFWQIISGIPGFGEPGAKQTTVAAQPVMLKALAKLTYDFAFGREKDLAQLTKLFDGLEDDGHLVDFSHDNPMWRYYQFNEGERKKFGLAGLAEFLPSEEGGNRDIGQYNEATKVMRFGAKHNDIYPILGDMVRWKLGLPNRNPKTVQ